MNANVIDRRRNRLAIIVDMEIGYFILTLPN
jgi:hypothetical protein